MSTVSPAVGETADRAAQQLALALSDALALDPARVRRLGRIGQGVRFNVGGADTGVLLAFDQQRAGVTRSTASAAIEFDLDPAQAALLAAGRLPLPTAVVCGQVRASGAVREYLEVDVILQSLLAEASGHSGGREQRAAAPGSLSVPGAEVLAIETRGLHKRFGRHEVLAGVSLMIPEGGISVVLGPSGTGKSVLLQHIIGLMRPDKGDVLIRGRSLSSMGRAELLGLRREIGVMFQDGALFSALNVYDNVAFPLREHTDLSDDAIDAVVLDRLRDVGLESAAGRFPAQLSGGMKKRAGLARALALDPGIVLCDEPDSGLDPVRTALLADLLIDQHANGGGTMLVVTHNIALAKHVADHITVLWQGDVRQAGMAAEIFESDDPFVQQFLAGASSGPLSME
jgi:phospholipid/cholesterol/gamma-HCH transport system ATP-binding protein